MQNEKRAHSKFGKALGVVFQLSCIESIDFSRIEQLEAVIMLTSGATVQVSGQDVLHLAYAVQPSAVEGKRLSFAKHAWFIHNVLGHPIMQLLALVKLYKAAFWVHEVTTPKAI